MGHSKLIPYTTNELPLIGDSYFEPVVLRPPSLLLQDNKANQKSSKPVRKQTRRGKRSGKRKQKQHARNNVYNLITTSDHSATKPIHNTPDLKMCLLNVQSSRNKCEEILDLIVDNDIDIMVLTETWLCNQGDESKIAAMTPDGYMFQHQPRLSRGGGIAIIYKAHLVLKVSNKQQTDSFESLDFLVSHGKTTTNFIALYRPPPSKKNGQTLSQFLQEFTLFMEMKVVERSRLVVLGDFNIYFDNTSNTETIQMIKLLDTIDCIQLVNGATHRSGHTLDWVLTKNTVRCVTRASVSDIQMSDHHLVTLDLDTKRPPHPKKHIRCRNIKKMDREAFRHDLQTSELLQNPPSDPDQYAELYNQVLLELLDKHAPEKVKLIPHRPETSWIMSPEIVEAKAQRRTAERAWRKSHLEIHRQIYRKARNKVTAAIKRSKQQAMNSKIEDSRDDPNSLYKAMFSLLGKEKQNPLPNLGDTKQTADAFQSFFFEKIERIREPMLSSTSNENSHTEPNGNTIPTMDSFVEFTEEEVLKLIRKSKPTSCVLDPIPTSLVLENIDVLLPVFTNIVNTSLRLGRMPKAFKSAIVKPLLKKANLDPDELKNFRPVSNLSFMSKVIERAVGERLTHHLTKHDLYEPYQSAYRKDHSTETTLLRVLNDLRLSVDNNKVSLLVLLDLSAAFDTIDHQGLLSRLKHSFGIDGIVLEWFTSYLSDRHQSVFIDGCFSESGHLHCGVPQGSVLGPVLFTLYTKDLGTLIDQFHVGRQLYADDTQLQKDFKPNPTDAVSATDHMSACCSEIKSWMFNNKLKLNDDKTECLLVGTSTRRAQTNINSFHFAETTVPLSSTVKDLGVTIDPELSLDQHITSISKTCFLLLRNIGNIRSLLTKSSAIILVLSLVMTRLDYCNSLFAGATKTQIARLQRIQNTAARIVSLTPKSAHITPVLMNLHWLPIKQRIAFKLCLLTHRCQFGNAPNYLCETQKPYQPSRCLRSQHSNLLCVPKVKTVKFGQRSFSYASASSWNSLPQHIRTITELSTFRTALKTHLFQEAFLQ